MDSPVPSIHQLIRVPLLVCACSGSCSCCSRSCCFFCAYIPVALLDSTVKVFHDDSLKFFLSLYGHKLPVMSMDISDDGDLLATGSADKTVKVWGLDFGDCHRSLLAHDDSIMVSN